MHKLKCIKCKQEYEDTEPEPFYCPPCNEERKRIAAEVDKKMANREARPVKTLLQEYDESPKMGQFMIIKN